MAWIETDTGIALPAPELGSGKVSVSTLVDGGRNAADGTFIGSVIGDDKLKIELQFIKLSPAEMQRFLAIFDRQQGGRFVNTFRVFDPRANDFVYKQMYVGDRSGTPYLVDKTTLRPAYWRDVTANLVEV